MSRPLLHSLRTAHGRWLSLLGQPPFGFNVFGIYKDNGRTVYTDPVLGAVSTIYYCVFVSFLHLPLDDKQKRKY